HYSAAADGYVRVTPQFQAGRNVIRKQEEVEPPHFVWTVIGAVARAHTAVIDHVIQAFSAVRGRTHRTDRLAWRIFALHAWDRLEVHSRIRDIALIVSINADPLHLAAALHLLLAYHGNVVFRLAGHRACLAADAGVQVYRHSPCIFFVVLIALRVPVIRIERLGMRLLILRLFVGVLMREVWIFNELLKRCRFHRLP